MYMWTLSMKSGRYKHYYVLVLHRMTHDHKNTSTATVVRHTSSGRILHSSCSTTTGALYPVTRPYGTDHDQQQLTTD